MKFHRVLYDEDKFAMDMGEHLSNKSFIVSQLTVYVVSFQTIHWKLHIIGCLILLTQADK